MLDSQKQRERIQIDRSGSGSTLGKDLLGVQIVVGLRQDEVRAQVQTLSRLMSHQVPD